MKYIFLDDERVTPPGWHRTYTVDETIEILCNANERIECVSLDNDLGEGVREGYHVARWIEAVSYDVQSDPGLIALIPKKILVHTANSSAAHEILNAIHAANNFLKSAGFELIEVARPEFTPSKYVYEFDNHDWLIKN